MGFREILIQRLVAYDPTVDVNDPRLQREVIGPLTELLGENIPYTDARALVESRLRERFPEVDNTVFVDLVGKPLEAVVAVLRREIAATRARRRGDDERLLTDQDKRDLTSHFLTDPTLGSFSKGVVRVFYATPRSILLDLTNIIQVAPPEGSTTARLYRPQAPVTLSSLEMRGNREGSLFYVDVPLVALEADPLYDLEPGEAQGATGFSGAVRVNNSRPFRGGRSDETRQGLLARIRTSLRARDLSSPAGAAYMLPGMGVRTFHIVQGGDARMVRDRIYGPVSISGIPGGFRDLGYLDRDIPSGEFVSLGIAADVWVASEESSTTPVEVSNLYDAGLEVFYAREASLVKEDPGGGDELYLRAPAFPTPPPEDDLYPELLHISRDLPLEEGSHVVIERRFTSAFVPREFDVEGFSDSEVELGDVAGIAQFPAVQGKARFSFRRSQGEIPAFLFRTWDIEAARETIWNQFWFSVPLYDSRAVVNDEEVRHEGGLAIPVPGTREPDSVAGVPVRIRRNIISDVQNFPLLSAERLEMLDALTSAPTGEYIYPRQPLFAEFQETRSGSLINKATKVRVHLLGPQATAVGGLVTDPTGATKMQAMFWGPMAALTAPSAEAQTATITVSSIPDPLSFIAPDASQSVTVPEREIRRGDWAAFRVTDSSFPEEVIHLPITDVSTAGGELTLTVAAEDLPAAAAGVEGELCVFQGASRETLLEPPGRGPEGTYSFDVWLRELNDAEETGYVPSEPPLLGTVAHIEPTGLLSQGFEILSHNPALYFSADERPTLLLQGEYAADGQELSGRSISVHAYPGSVVRTVQDALDADGRAIGTALAKSFTPAYVSVGLYYDAQDLDAEEAASTVYQELIRGATVDGRIELSDLKEALYTRGADYVLAGRIFILRQDHLRRWTYEAARNAFALQNISQVRPVAITCTRLRRRERGETIDEFDPSNWAEPPFTLRPGGFDAD